MGRNVGGETRETQLFMVAGGVDSAKESRGIPGDLGESGSQDEPLNHAVSVVEREGNEQELPSHPTQSASVYRFFDAEDVLLYVGMTADGHRRTRAHAKEKDWWPEVARSTVEHYESREDAREVELIAIEYEQPIYNVADRKPVPMLGGVPLRLMHATEDFVGEVEWMCEHLWDLFRAVDGVDGFTEVGEAECVKALTALEALASAEREWLDGPDS